MGKAAYTLLVAFAASILTLVAVNLLAPEEDDGAPAAIVTVGPTATLAAGETPRPTPSATASGALTAAVVAQYSSAQSCWLIIDGRVYDVTTCISRHPTPPEVLTAWCGKEATEAWETKGSEGDDHSSRAAAALEDYEIGVLAR